MTMQEPSQPTIGFIGIGHMGSSGLIAPDQDVGVGFPEHNKGPFAGAEFLRSGDHALEHRIKLQRGTEAPGEVDEHLGFASPALHLGG